MTPNCKTSWPVLVNGLDHNSKLWKQKQKTFYFCIHSLNLQSRNNVYRKKHLLEDDDRIQIAWKCKFGFLYARNITLFTISFIFFIIFFKLLHVNELNETMILYQTGIYILRLIFSADDQTLFRFLFNL